MDVFKTLLVDSPTVLASDGTGLLQASNNLSDVDDVGTSRDNLDVYSKAEVNANNFIKQDSGFALSDGSTNNRAERAQYGAVGDVAGLPCTVVVEGYSVPTSNPSLNQNLSWTSGTAFPSFATSEDNGQQVTMLTTGELIVRADGATAPTDFRRFGWTGFRAAFSGQTVRIAIAFPEGDSTTSPTITINGEDQSSNFALTTGGTVPNWMDANLVTSNTVYGFGLQSGRAPYSRVIVGALSDTEAANYTAGMPLEQAAPWTKYAGSAVSLRDGDTLVAGAHAPDTLTVSGMSITSCIDDGTTVAHVVNNTAFGPLTVGRTYAVHIPDFVLNSGSYPDLRIGTAINLTEAGNGYLNIANYAGAAYYTFTPTGSVSNLRLGWRITAATNFSHGEMTLYEVGPLDRPIYQPALATDDGFGRFSRRLVGMTPVSARSDFRVIGNTATSGNEQVLGGAVLDDADAVIDSVEFDTDGTPTITLGSASGGAQYVASTTLSAGLNADETLVTRKAASTALWVGSNATSAVRTYVSGHKINGV